MRFDSLFILAQILCFRSENQLNCGSIEVAATSLLLYLKVSRRLFLCMNIIRSTYSLNVVVELVDLEFAKTMSYTV